MVNAPVMSVVVVYFLPVRVLVAVTLTPGKGVPPAFTLPRMVPPVMVPAVVAPVASAAGTDDVAGVEDAGACTSDAGTAAAAGVADAGAVGESCGAGAGPAEVCAFAAIAISIIIIASKLGVMIGLG